MGCGFWQVLPSIVTTIAVIITAGATYEIMRFTQIQSDVSSQKRKDDLFKIRYEFYKEVVSFIKKNAPIIRNYIVSSSGHYDAPADSNGEKININKWQYKFDLGAANIVTKAEWLISTDLAGYLKSYLSSKEFLQTLGTYNTKTGITEDIWTPDKEFNAQFEKYLKLK